MGYRHMARFDDNFAHLNNISHECVESDKINYANWSLQYENIGNNRDAYHTSLTITRSSPNGNFATPPKAATGKLV
jgi:hypothetical protein